MVIIGLLNNKLHFCSVTNTLFEVGIYFIIKIGIEKHPDYRVECFIDTTKPLIIVNLYNQ